MNRTQLLVAIAFASALSVVACTSSSEPEQQSGVTTYQQSMSQADAQKLIDSLNTAGHKCYAPCSYGPADAKGNVVFEAELDCAGDTDDMCTLLVNRMCN